MDIVSAIKDKRIRRKVRYVYFLSIVIFFILCLTTDVNVKEDKEYEDFNHIVMYIYEYNELPSNYIPKIQVNLIEGEELYFYDNFMNIEELLPIGEQYTEVYINATKGDPGAERLVYTADIVYYTSDHYESFTEVTKTNIQTPYIIFTVLLILEIVGGASIMIVVVAKYKIIGINDLKNDFSNDYQEIKKAFIKIITKVKSKTFEAINKDIDDDN